MVKRPASLCLLGGVKLNLVLPLPGIAASISAIELSFGGTSPGELQKCLVGMCERGVLVPVTKKEIFHVRGEPVPLHLVSTSCVASFCRIEHGPCKFLLACLKRFPGNT
eukprot:5407582-Amphidinium_carterae.1